MGPSGAGSGLSWQECATKWTIGEDGSVQVVIDGNGADGLIRRQYIAAFGVEPNELLDRMTRLQEVIHSRLKITAL